ncbi:HD domain-containing protein [Eubacteriales bacterium OttesenSCG-928-N13]|nr:HD domain-containing protein [Eubacteriales bacterium OttesenSCG-928-N13]
MEIIAPVRMLLERLLQEGHQAYAVGGCVRDSLLGRSPHDWDITTSATPEQTRSCMGELRTFDTGLHHGTLSVLVDGTIYEITTFRADGEYLDHRRPDSVQFVHDIKKDLARRDFTINAMALDIEGNLIDPFGGQQDLRDGSIRCVGDPNARFEEDALRILRALRFASCYGFSVEQQTAQAMREKQALLRFVSAERIYEELKRMLCGQGVHGVLMAFPDILSQIIPEIAKAVRFAQHNPHHDSDVWEHTLRAVAAVPPESALRLAMLLHDLGKPECFTMDEQGIGHFYGHAKPSERIARDALHRLKADRRTTQRVVTLVRVHDLDISPTEEIIKRRLNTLGEQMLKDLIHVQRADSLAQSSLGRQERLDALDQCEQLLERLLQERACFSLNQLVVKGGDLIGIGVPEGMQVGMMLHALLEQVLDGTLPNDRDALIDAAKRMMKA